MNDSWHYDTISVVDSIQTALLIVLTVIIWKRRKTTKNSEASLLTSYDTERRFLTQMLVLTVFYVFATVSDWLQHYSNKRNIRLGNLECVDNVFIVVVNKKGALHMLAGAAHDFLSSLVIIFVFFEMPKRYFG